MNRAFRSPNRCLLAVVGAAVLAMANSANGANWLELQGVSPPKAPRVTVGGFFIPDYKYMSGTTAANGQVPRENLIGPQFSSSNSFNILFARLIIRGNINKNISYFLGGEFGNNAFDYVGGSYSPHLMDAHVTFSYIPGVRIQGGIIRAPGSEEAMQGYVAYNFGFNYTTVLQQLVLQPFYNTNATYEPGPYGSYLVSGADTRGNNAFRYPGIEALDWFRNGPWEFAYAVMAGNFGPLTSVNTSNGLLVAGRLQASYILSGFGPTKGPFRSDVTGFVWYQHANPMFNGRAYSLTRDGIGVAYMQGYMHPWGRWAKVEYMRGSGMISAPAAFNGFTGEPAPNTPQYAALTNTQVYPGSENRASGWYAAAGLFVTHRLELDARYDYYDRLPNIAAQERVFKTLALGLQYHFTPLTRVGADYFIRSVNIPNVSAIPAAQRPLATSIADGVDNMVAITGVIAF